MKEETKKSSKTKKEKKPLKTTVSKKKAEVKKPRTEKPKIEKLKIQRPKKTVVTKEKKIKPPPMPIKEKAQKITAVEEKVQEKPIAAQEPVQPRLKPIERAPAPVKEAARVPPEVKKPAVELKELELELPITVKDLSVKLQLKPSLLIKKLMDLRIMAGINQSLEEDTVAKICSSFSFQLKKALPKEEEALQVHKEQDPPHLLKPRPPVVTLMGHVDHGKTSLLDVIRKTQVAEKEYGGITQHIGAYEVISPKGKKVTFLDTPGHEAFTAMRARGARCTDIVVLVVAADDGVMPQTIEAIDHARAANVPIVVAMNKIDKPQANIDRLKKQLGDLGLLAEDWGGKTITIGVSAKTGERINDLLDMILLEAEMLELKANYQKPASGIVIEAKVSKGRGPVATLLIQNGTLRLDDSIVVGKFYGKIKSMHNDKGKPQAAGEPSDPVEVSGLSGVPEAGEQFFVVADEKTARDIALKRQEQERLQELKVAKKISLDDLYKNIKEGKLKELKIILKSDVQGSLEAIKEAIRKLNITEIQLNIIHEGIGTLNSSDVILAAASDALILGFNVTVDNLAKELTAKEGVDVRTYTIIYELANDLKVAVEGMLEPKLKKIFLGRAEIRKVFRLSRAGTVAGSFVSKGKIARSADIALIRNGEMVFEGKLSSLKRFKDDAREVTEGFECGISIAGHDDIQEGDIIEAYEIQQIARKL